jgi:hypothetical protein
VFRYSCLLSHLPSLRRTRSRDSAAVIARGFAEPGVRRASCVAGGVPDDREGIEETKGLAGRLPVVELVEPGVLRQLPVSTLAFGGSNEARSKVAPAGQGVELSVERNSNRSEKKVMDAMSYLGPTTRQGGP